MGLQMPFSMFLLEKCPKLRELGNNYVSYHQAINEETDISQSTKIQKNNQKKGILGASALVIVPVVSIDNPD